MDTIFVYKTPSEASEIRNTPGELALWASAGYFPLATGSAPAAVAPEVDPPASIIPPDTTSMPPEGSQDSGKGPDVSAIPPDGKPADTGSAPAAVAPVAGREKPAKG